MKFNLFVRSHLIVAALALCLLPSAVLARSTTLVEPDPVTITYKDSSGLNYAVKDDGTRRIHPRPVGWMKNLSDDIQRATNNLCHK